MGGKAEAWVEPKDLADLSRVIKFSRKKRVSVFIIGAGSNLLISDKGFKGVVIKLSQPFFTDIKFKNNYLWVGAGLSLRRLVNLTKNKGLSGCEFLAGIPGTVGGALIMNAGVSDVLSLNKRYLSMGDLVEEVRVLGFNGRKKNLKKKEIKFGYRNSNLSKFIIVSAKLKLKSQPKKAIECLIKKFISYKSKIQDLKSGSAGCVFKNPLSFSQDGSLTAGKLIDACGMKGKRKGKAIISRVHANFILNTGGTKAKDIFRLMRLAQKQVKQRFNILLEPELKIIGKF